MSSNGQLVRFEELALLGFGDITGSYTVLAGPYQHAIRMLLIENTGDTNVYISFDGVTNHMVVPASSGKVLDYASNRVDPVAQLEQPLGTTVYVQAEAGLPTLGAVYASAVYAANR